MKSPLFSYKTKDFEFETESFKNAVAPLEFPFTKVGIVRVAASFKVTSVVVWISYREIFHWFKFKFAELYDPDSNLKS